MARFPERLPAPLSERIASASAAIYNRQGREYDLAIGGIPFLLANYGDLPKTLETVPVRKDQFDTEQDPGEQSLTSWWRRSQSSFHEGAGLLYQEDASSNAASNGFYDSDGIDVFTQGRFTLLKKMKTATNSVGSPLSRVRTFSTVATRTNLCTNPGFETSNANWTTSANGGPGSDLPTLTRDTSKFDTGAASGRVDWGTDDATGFPPAVIVPFTVPNNTTYTVTAKVWVPSGNPAVTLVGDGVFGTTSSVNDAWTTITVTSNSIGGTGLAAFWPASPVAVGKLFYIDSVLVEATAVSGSYFDGNSTNGSWTGTTNLSTSNLSIPDTGANFSAVGGGKLATSTSASGAYTALHSPATTIVDGLISGGNFYDVASDGTLYQGLVSSPGTATTWPCGTTPSRIGWGKHRLWIIGGRKLWQPNLSLAGGTAQNPIFTHPNQGWTYTCMAEGPSAMYFGGHDGYSSSIQAITLDSGGGLPTLSGASDTVLLPPGELVQEIAVLAGEFLGIGTNRGFRMGTISGDGSITYGPLIVEPDGVLACTALTAQERFFLVAFSASGGMAKAYRVDTSTKVTDGGVFAYASDIKCDRVGWITSLAAPSTSQLVATTDDGQPWYQSTTEYVDSGWIQSGRIRYRTTEKKSFKFLSLEIDPLHGNIAVDLIKEGASTLALGSITQQGEIFEDNFSIQSDAMRYASVKFTLTPNGTQAPVVFSYLLRALPAVAPQRMHTIPLLCYDREKARSGQYYGADGYANDRLTALQLLEDSAETVVFQDFSLSGDAGQIVTIESVRFIQNSPARSNQADQIGGYLVVQLRTVA